MDDKDANENKSPQYEMYSKEYYRHVVQQRRKMDAESKARLAKAEGEYWDKFYKDYEILNPEPERLKHIGDNPNALDNTPATILYVFVMIGGSIFNDRIWIWIIATIIWLKHIFRMNIKREQVRKEEEERMRRK